MEVLDKNANRNNLSDNEFRGIQPSVTSRFGIKTKGLDKRQGREKLNGYYFQMTWFLTIGNPEESIVYDHELKIKL